jgi:hypothetical protein
MEAGGPMGRDKRLQSQNSYLARRGDGEVAVIEGVPSHRKSGEEFKIASPERGGRMHGDHLPHSGGPLQSGIGRELAVEKYANRKGCDGESGNTAVRGELFVMLLQDSRSKEPQNSSSVQDVWLKRAYRSSMN